MTNAGPTFLLSSAAGSGTDGLPVPVREDRWQPLRCGLLNIYRYDYEEFRFEQGRLLLRGDNGTGKSRVLALQLPFLLDGDVSPSRVEPDGDPAKRIEWHLLMGRWPDRTGYTWIEFGRARPGSGAEFVTLGCGMRAVAGQTGLHSRWLFITRQRIGRDLFLQSADCRPLGRERLEQALGAVGRVFPNAEEYRRAVDDALFGLGTRYDRLVDLLIRLRRPKLSQKLDEEELSATLSEALPVLSGTLIDEVAEAFRSLQTDRDSLRSFVETRVAVEDFLREYGVYACVAVRRRAAGVRSAHSHYEESQRAVRDAERRVADADARLVQIEGARVVLDRDQAAAEEVVRTLRASPEMQTAAELDRAGHAALAAQEAQRDSQSDAERARQALANSRDEAELAEQQHTAVTREVEAQYDQAQAAAAAAEMTESHRDHLGATVPESASDAVARAGRAAAALDRAIRKRRETIEHLRALEREVALARRDWETSEAERRRAADASHAAREAEREARLELGRMVAAYEADFAFWRERLTILAFSLAAVEAVAEEFARWIERREGVNPWRRLAEAAYRQTIAGLADLQAQLGQRLTREDEALALLRAELELLEQGQAPDPPVPPQRRADRTGRPGAPLWRLCDFRTETSEEQRAGVEAALEASGLVDAWLLPDGRLIDPQTEDTFLRIGDPPDGSGVKTHLGRWLVPALDPGDPGQRDLTTEMVGRLLEIVGGGRDCGLHWVDADGSWRLGPVTGRWSKPAAAYIGESTRAEARRRRIAELRLLYSERETVRERLRADLRQVEGRRATADTELAALPDDRPVFEAGFRLSAATAAIAEAFAAHERAEHDAAQKRSVLERTEARRDRDAADLRLSGWLGRLDVLERRLAEYGMSLAALWPRLGHWGSTAEALSLARQRLGWATAEANEQAARHQKAAEDSAAARSRFETLRDMHGATIAVVQENLRQAEARTKELKQSSGELQREQLEKASARAGATADREHAIDGRSRHEESRRSAIASLQNFATHRLLGEAHEQLAAIEAGPWAVARAVEIARQIEPLLAGTAADDDAWRRRQDSIHAHVQELRDRLIAHNHQPETHQVEDLVLVRCVFQARTHTMTELCEAFASEIRERERLLEAREREVIENHLLGEVAVELQRLVRGAEEWIASANRELAGRATSTGLRFRFAWEPAVEGAFASVRKTFLRTSELWSPAERDEITRYLQERIRVEQGVNEQGSWRDHLAAALDYRRWHRFLVERQQEGQWRRLDKRTYGTGSGGEKALALTLPRFAAAAAHYRSARADAPRLVMLDEAFAGIDPTMRAQCMGILAQFDLDVVMTSELEWGCYATVPGLAIYHLTTSPGIDAVVATRWIWNGRERRRIEVALPPSTPPSAEPDSGPTQPEDLTLLHGQPGSYTAEWPPDRERRLGAHDPG